MANGVHTLGGVGKAKARAAAIGVVVACLVAGLVPFAGNPPAKAALVPTARAFLHGAAEEDGGDPDGRGTAELQIDTDTNQLCLDLTTSGIAPMTGLHIHQGGFGVNGPVVVEFSAGGPTGPSGASSVSAAANTTCTNDTDADAIAADPTAFYVNVHTFEHPFPRGAIRGQLVRAGQAASDVQVKKRGPGAPVAVGSEAIFDLTTTFHGPDSASNISISDVFSGSGNVTSIDGFPGFSCAVDPANANHGVVCTAPGPIAPGTTLAARIGFTPDAAGQVQNTVSVQSDADPIAANDTATATATAQTGTPEAQADLEITKQAVPSEDGYTVGEHITYQINVSNHGPDTATGVTVTDDLPQGVSFVSADTDQGGPCSEAAGVVTCPIGDLASGANVDVTVVVQADQTGDIFNQAFVAGDGTFADPNSENDSFGDWQYIEEAAANLSIYKYADNAYPGAGRDFRYLLPVYNSGPLAAENVVITDPLPADVTFVSAEIPGGTCAYDSSTREVICRLASMARDTNTTAVIAVTAPSVVGVQVQNQATVSSDTPDSFPNDNTYSYTTTVAADSADLTLSKYHRGGAQVAVGDPIRWEVNVYNQGPGTATGVVLTDTLPAGTTFQSADVVDPYGGYGGYYGPARSCTESGGVVTCQLGELGRYYPLTVRINALATTTGLVTNQATVTADQEANSANNSASENVQVVANTTDLAITKTEEGGYDPAAVNSSLTYAIAVNNPGPAIARDVEVVDDLPAGTTFVAASATLGDGTALPPEACSYDSSVHRVVCAVGDMDISNYYFMASARVAITVTTPGTVGEMVNQASVSTSTSDTNADNNSVSETTTLSEPGVDLSIAKYGPSQASPGEQVYWNLSGRNSGPSTATNVVVQDTLPPGATYNYSSAQVYDSGYSYRFVQCSESGGVVTCDLGDLPRNNFYFVTVGAILGDQAVATNQATISSDPTERNPADNSASFDTQVSPPRADLGLTKSANPTSASAGDPVRYSLQVQNYGPRAAENVVVTDTLPAGVRFESAQARTVFGSLLGSCTHSGEASGGTVTCSLGNMNYGHFFYNYAFVDIVVVPTAEVQSATNTASVTSSTTEPDPDAHPNTASADITVGPAKPTDLSVYKWRDRQVWATGENQTWNVDVNNYGEGRAPNTVLTDTLPGGLDFVAATVDGGLGTCSFDQASRQVTCALGTLDPYYSYYSNYNRRVRITVLPTVVTSPDLITNTATATSDRAEASPEDYPNTYSDSVEVRSNEVDLYLNKYEFDDPVLLNNTVNWQFQMYNRGPGTATGVTLADRIPDGFTYESASGGTCTASGQDVTCAMADIEPLRYGYLQITARGHTLGEWTNRATVSSTKPEVPGQEADNTDSESTTVALDQADLQVSKSQSQANPVIGEQFYYYLSTYNAGPGAATSTVLTDTLPEGLTLNSLYDPYGACSYDAGTRTLTCNYGTVQRYQSRYVYLGVTGSNTAEVTNTATVSTTKTDSDPGNNQASVTTNIDADEADVSLTKSVSRDPGIVDEQQYYDLRITNSGPGTATGVRVVDEVPGSLRIDSVSDPSCSVAGNQVSCEVGSMARNAFRSVRINVTPTQSGQVTNTATVTTTKTDPNPENNQASTTSQVGADEVDLQAYKQASRNPGVVGEQQWFFLQAINHGPAVANNLTLTDTIPSNFRIDGIRDSSVANACSASGQTVSCAFGNHGPGSSGYVYVDVTPVSPSAVGEDGNRVPITNTVTVDSDITEVDNEAYPNAASANVTVLPDEVDLQAYKQASRNPGVVGEQQWFFLQAINHGPAVADNVTLTDTIPSNFRIDGIRDSSVANACSVSGQTVSCAFGNLGAGSSGYVYVDVTPVTPSAVGDGGNRVPVTNTVEVDSDTTEVDNEVYPNAASANVTVLPDEVDLQAYKQASRNPGVVGEQQWFFLQAINHGPAVADNVTLTDTIPSNFRIDGIRDSSVANACSVSGQTVSCAFGNLGAGSSGYVYVDVTPLTESPKGANGQRTPVRNTVTVASDSTEVASGSYPNTAFADVVIEPVQVDLEAFKSARPIPGTVGEPMEFTLRATNHGPAIAHGVTLTDTFPAELSGPTITSSTHPGACSVSGQTVTCAFGDVADETSATVTVVATPTTATPPNSGYSNTVTVASTSPEVAPQSFPNSYTLSGIPVVPDEVDLVAFKATQPHGRVGEAQSYYLEVGNSSYATASNVQMVDAVPPEFTITSVTDVTADGSCTVVGQTVTCTFPSLGAFASAAARVNVAPTALGTFTNHLSVTADEPEIAGQPSDDNVFSLTHRISAPPTVNLAIDDPEGVFPHTVVATLNATDPESDPLTYQLTWGDGAFQSGPLTPGMTLQHTYVRRGPFVASLLVSDGGPQVQDSEVITVDLPQPLTADAGQDQVTTANAPEGIVLDGEASTPEAGIVSYEWALSDGRTFAGQVTPELTFPTPDVYTATLTVRSGPDSATDTAQITVGPEPLFQGLKVNVVRADNGAKIPGAEVLVSDANGVKYSDLTEQDPGRTDYGRAFLHGLANGEYTVYVVKQGYRPNEAQAAVVNDQGEVTVALEEGEFATASLTAERLTAEEAIAAGIDPADPANNNAYEFEIHLAFNTQPITFSGFVTEGNGFFDAGFGGGGGCSAFTCNIELDGYEIQVEVQYVEDTPTLVYMVIPGRAKWLKEFYDVQMTVQNLGSPSFVLTDGVAQLHLPGNNALALPALFGSVQQNPVPMEDIPGGESRTARWIVRGDAEGLYGGPGADEDHDLFATYAGTLRPIVRAVNLTARLAGPIRVWGLSAIRLEVDADDQAFERHPYDVTVSIRNITDSDPDEQIPLDNVSLELFEEGTQRFIYQPGQELVASTAQLLPGQVLSLHAVLIPDFTGTLDLSQSFVRKKAGGEVDDTAVITSHPATPLAARPTISGSTIPQGVHLSWQAVPGATSYEIWTTPNRETHFTGAPLLAVPGSQTAADVPAPPGQGEFAVVPLFGGVETRDMRHPLIQLVSGAVPSGQFTISAATPDPVPEGDSGTTPATFTISLTPTGDSTSRSVSYATQYGSATAGVDYVYTEETVIFAPGETSKDITVDVIGDNAAEPNETFFVQLYNPTGGSTLGPRFGRAVIRNDDDSVPTVSISNAIPDPVPEGDSGTTPATFTVNLDSPSDSEVTVSYATQYGNATPDSDYVYAESSVTFAPGETSKTITVDVKGDTDAESNETFLVQLYEEQGADLGQRFGRATIANDDADVPTLSISDVAGPTPEGQPLSFSVTLTGSPPVGPVTVHYATMPGYYGSTATVGSDYAYVESTITFAPGEMSKTILVPTLTDGVSEGTEDLWVQIYDPVGASLNPSERYGHGFIADSGV